MGWNSNVVIIVGLLALLLIGEAVVKATYDNQRNCGVVLCP